MYQVDKLALVMRLLLLIRGHPRGPGFRKVTREFFVLLNTDLRIEKKVLIKKLRIKKTENVTRGQKSLNE